MAQRVEIVLSDDLDGSAAQETVRFGLDGRSYEIDLSADNAAALREELGRYVDAGRRASNVVNLRRSAKGYDVATVKAWADSTGRSYPARGRLPKSLVAEFKEFKDASGS